jgi:hypothetical protein
MFSTPRPRPAASLPRPSIIFPVCVITVALSAISPARSVLHHEIVSPASVSAIRLFPAAHSLAFDDDDDTQALEECLASEAGALE